MTIAIRLNLPAKKRLFMRFVPDCDTSRSGFIPIVAEDTIPYIRSLVVHHIKSIDCEKWCEVYITEAGKGTALMDCATYTKETDEIIDWM